MAHAGSVAERHPRLSLFVRSQLPVAASLTVLRLLMLVFGIQIEHPWLLGAGAITVGLVTVASLVLPWERWPVRTQIVPASIDLIALTLVSMAMFGEVATVGTLAAFPAIWLAVVAGWWGVVIGVVGAFAASTLPLLLISDTAGRNSWPTALVVPGVLLIVVVVARILTERFDNAAAAMRAMLVQRNAAAADAERLDTVLRSFADGVDLGVLFLDHEGEPIIFNKALLAFGELARYDDGTGRGMRMYAADQVTPLAADEQPLARIRRGETLDDFLHWVGPRGRQRALVANGRRVQRPDGELAGSMIIVQDVTDVVRTGRAREDALATLAHELRTPLTSIVGYADLLELDDLSEQARTRLEVISRNAEHLLSLTSTFLDGLHPEAAVRHERLDLLEVVEATLDVLRTTPGFSDRELTVQVTPGLVVVADREGLSAVLNNLLSNAVKFSRVQDRIDITGWVNDAGVSIRVRNTGSHIDPEDLERIFDRFYRGANAQREAVAGTGIGLSVSRDIVAAHGGTLTADAVAEGASFTLCLPCD